jgi:hypothetical protein
MLRRITIPIILVMAGCATSRQFDYSQTSLAIVPLERRVDPTEIFDVVERQVAAAPVCIPIPNAFWEMRTPFTARFGPTEWAGRSIATDIEARLDDFVEMGFWTRTVVSSDADRVVRFHLTELGAIYYRGHPYHPRVQGWFCAPGERRLLRIVETKTVPESKPTGQAIGFHPPASLLVRFEWIGSEAPSWLPTPELRARYGDLAPRHERPSTGSIELFRVWRRG